MRIRGPFPLIPLVLTAGTLVALLQLLRNDHVYTWAFVLAAICIAATVYAAAQETRATQALAVARRRAGSIPRDEVHREIDRARRQGRPLAIGRVDLPPSAGRGSAALTRELLGHGPLPVMRSSDRVWKAGRSVYFLLPETTRESAKRMLHRISLREEAIEMEHVRVVAFPEDAVTIGALFDLLGSSEPTADMLLADPRRMVHGEGVRETSTDD